MALTGLDASRFTRSTKIIAVADVVESVRLMERSEQDFIARWQHFVDYVQELVSRESGKWHKSLGDGFMLEFADARSCIRAAVAMQAWFDRSNRDLEPAQQAHLRIGAHLAEYVADKYDIYGSDVNVASRIVTLAGPGEIVVSAAFRKHLGALPGVQVQDLGSCHLKHVKQPLQVYRIGAAGRAPVMPSEPLQVHALRATISVLPFSTAGEDPHAVHGDDLAEEMIAALTRSDTFHVLSRVPVHGADGPAPARPRYLLSGRARRQVDTLVLYAELTDAQSGQVVWADHFRSCTTADGVLDPRFLPKVVLAMHAAVIHHEVEVARGRPLPALPGPTLLLAALGLMHRLSPVDMDQSRGMLEHLTDRWRRHATAHAWLAHLHVLRVQQAGAGGRGADQALARAHAAAGVHCDPDSALVLALDGHATLHGAGHMRAAADRYAQALSVDPDHSLTQLFRAELLALQGSGRLASSLAARATQSLVLEPLRYMYDAIAALAALADDDAAAAARLAQQSLDRNPRYLPAWHALIVAQVESERLGEARANQQQLLRRQPAFSVGAFVDATPLGEDLARRFAHALASAGAPR